MRTDMTPPLGSRVARIGTGPAAQPRQASTRSPLLGEGQPVRDVDGAGSEDRPLAGER